MRAYYIRYEFYYNDRLRGTYSYDTLTDCPPIAGEIAGDDFDRLWVMAVEYGIRVPLCLWNRKGKRSIEIFDTFIRVTPKNCKPWKLVICVEETTISMKELMRYDADKVVCYIADILKKMEDFEVDRFELVKSLVNQKFGEVRVLVEDDGVLFCAKDIAVALGYSNPRKTVADHRKRVTKRKTLTDGGVQKRISQLQTRAGVELELVYQSMICSNAFSIERDVHAHFDSRRTFGEWFKVSPAEVTDYLDNQKYVLKSEYAKYLSLTSAKEENLQ